MRHRFLGRLAAASVVALAVPALALAGDFVLHPSGFGAHSYSAWKADEGLPDSHGGKDQALYFQKNTATTTVAAGVAVFKGVEGMEAGALFPLSFYVRADGHCGAGAPRFNLRVENPTTGIRHTAFIGCQEMVLGDEQSHEGRTFQRRTALGPPATVPGTFRVVSLSIVFDEGRDVGRCRGGLGLISGESCTHLDDITVADHTWTSASDNGNNETVVQSTTALDLLLGESIALALAPTG
jgi:hypothetical protein